MRSYSSYIGDPVLFVTLKFRYTTSNRKNDPSSQYLARIAGKVEKLPIGRCARRWGLLRSSRILRTRRLSVLWKPHCRRLTAFLMTQVFGQPNEKGRPRSYFSGHIRVPDFRDGVPDFRGGFPGFREGVPVIRGGVPYLFGGIPSPPGIQTLTYYGWFYPRMLRHPAHFINDSSLLNRPRAIPLYLRSKV